MCNHDRLVVKNTVENQVASSGLGLPDGTGWSLTVSNWADQSFNYCMGRVYECLDCGEIFVIQSMFRLERSKNENG